MSKYKKRILNRKTIKLVYLLFQISLIMYILFFITENETTTLDSTILVPSQIVYNDLLVLDELIEDSGYSKEELLQYDFGVAFYNPTTGQQFYHNADKYYFAASTVKVGIAILVAENIESGKMSLDQTITYNPIYYEGGTGIMQTSPEGTYTIETLVTNMIVYSDNIATNMLIGALGDEYVPGMIRLTHDGYREGNYITPRGSLYVLEELYLNPSGNQYYDDIIYLMKNTVFDDYFSKYLPDEVVAHKIGSMGDIQNDIGIIYADQPFLLSMYCTSGEQVCKELEAITAKTIFDEINEKASRH